MLIKSINLIGVAAGSVRFLFAESVMAVFLNHFLFLQLDGAPV
jgi:hypothetical protein